MPELEEAAAAAKAEAPKAREPRVYARFDEGGAPLGFYREGVHRALPPSAVEITEADWRLLTALPPTHRWNARAGACEPIPPPTEAERRRAAALMAAGRLAALEAAPLSADAEAILEALLKRGPLREADLPAALLARLRDRRALRALAEERS